MAPIRVLLAEDHQILREGTRQLLAQVPDIKVVAEAADGEEAIRLVGECRPDVVVLDVRMPKLNGIETARLIRANYPQVRILILSAHEDDRYVFPLLEAGADGYLLKTSSGKALAQAIHAVFQGETALDPQIAAKMVKRLGRRQLYRVEGTGVGLTEREVQVLQVVAHGHSNREVGDILCISSHTVQVHLRNIFAKLGVGSRTEAVAYALSQGWIELES